MQSSEFVSVLFFMVMIKKKKKEKISGKHIGEIRMNGMICAKDT